MSSAMTINVFLTCDFSSSSVSLPAAAKRLLFMFTFSVTNAATGVGGWVSDITHINLLFVSVCCPSSAPSTKCVCSCFRMVLCDDKQEMSTDPQVNRDVMTSPGALPP